MRLRCQAKTAKEFMFYDECCEDRECATQQGPCIADAQCGDWLGDDLVCGTNACDTTFGFGEDENCCVGEFAVFYRGIWGTAGLILLNYSPSLVDLPPFNLTCLLTTSIKRNTLEERCDAGLYKGGMNGEMVTRSSC